MRDGADAYREAIERERRRKEDLEEATLAEGNRNSWTSKDLTEDDKPSLETEDNLEGGWLDEEAAFSDGSEDNANAEDGEDDAEFGELG